MDIFLKIFLQVDICTSRKFYTTPIFFGFGFNGEMCFNSEKMVNLTFDRPCLYIYFIRLKSFDITVKKQIIVSIVNNIFYTIDKSYYIFKLQVWRILKTYQSYRNITVSKKKVFFLTYGLLIFGL